MTEGPVLDHVLNRLHQGIAKISIADIPISFEGNVPAMETVNGLITDFIAPGISIRYETEYSYNVRVHIPIQEPNEFDKLLTINMISDDRNENYHTLWRYGETLQSGHLAGAPILDTKHRTYGDDGIYRQRRSYISNIDVIIGDGSFQRHAIIRYKRCFMVNLSELAFNQSGGYVNFNASFNYSDREYIRMPVPSSDIVPPLHVGE